MVRITTTPRRAGPLAPGAMFLLSAGCAALDVGSSPDAQLAPTATVEQGLQISESASKAARPSSYALAGVALDGAPWVRHTIAQGAQTGLYRGADGADLRSDAGGLHLATAWEEGGIVTVSTLAPGADPRAPWPTAIAASKPFVEDAKLGDFDGDGRLDVASASDGGQLLYLSFAGATGGYTTTTVTSSAGHGRWMQVVPIDVDGDGLLDLAAGSRVGTPAVVAWFRNPGATARDGATWSYHQATRAGWIMSLLALDVDGDGDQDLVASDRSSYQDAAGVRQWDLSGARWIENVDHGASWQNHAMETPGTCATCTPGDEMMLALADLDGDGRLDVIDGQSSTGHANRVAIHRNPGWFTRPPWPTALVPTVEVDTAMGHYQGVAVGDVDRDGALDLVVSTWETNALPTSLLTGVYWLRNLGAGAWQHHEISGPEGSKWDNAVLYDLDGDGDLDVIETEQIDNLGIIWFENPCAIATH
jgi:FG-GAP-like repeat